MVARLALLCLVIGSVSLGQWAEAYELRTSVLTICRHEDKMVTIEDVIGKLYVQYSHASNNRNASDNDTLLQSFHKAVQEEYRPQVLSLLNDSATQATNAYDEGPAGDESIILPAMERYKRQIEDELMNVPVPFFMNRSGYDVGNAEEVATSTETDANNILLDDDWKQTILTCIYNYRVLTRIIEFEKLMLQASQDLSFPDDHDSIWQAFVRVFVLIGQRITCFAKRVGQALYIDSICFQNQICVFILLGSTVLLVLVYYLFISSDLKVYSVTLTAYPRAQTQASQCQWAENGSY